MKAVQFDRIGEPEVLRVAEVAEPHPGADQVRIIVRAAGVNPVDWKIRGGSTLRTVPTPLPHIPGLEAAGVVDEIGAGVSGVEIGQEVFGAAHAASAEYAVLHEWRPKPPTMSWAEAAGLPMAVETAARGLDRLALTSGQLLLVNGAAGGVGLAAVQLALGRGLRVIGTASAANLDFLQSLGALATTYGPGLAERVRQLVIGADSTVDGSVARSVDGVVDGALDIAGSDALPTLLALTGSPDRVVSIGDAKARDLGIFFTTGEEGRAFHALTEAAALHTAGRFSLPVRTWPMRELAQAHRVSEAGHVRGKLVVTAEF